MAHHGVITGTGAVCPLGRTASEFARRLFAGESAIRPFAPEERDGLQATHVARCDGFSPQPEIAPMKARRFDRGSQFAIIACAQALAEARYDVASAPEKIGIAFGTGSAGAGALTEFLRVLLVESPEAAPPFHFPNTVANAPASQVSIELKLLGPNVTITQKDPSALNALLFSSIALSTGRARAMLAGGVDEWNRYYALGFDRVGALRGDKRGSGIIQGEGGFAVLLETEESARERGVGPLAAVTGLATTGAPCEPYRFVADRRAIERTIRRALEDAGLSPSMIDMVLPSRNGVLAVDRAEEEVLSSVFGHRPTSVSVKDAIGEMAAAGGGQMVAASRAVSPRESPLPEARRPRRVLIDSFGAGGNFLAAVIESVETAA
jgi:3-oxoacyl-(acyl-carrier-protein) synthase